MTNSAAALLQHGGPDIRSTVTAILLARRMVMSRQKDHFVLHVDGPAGEELDFNLGKCGDFRRECEMVRELLHWLRDQSGTLALVTEGLKAAHRVYLWDAHTHDANALVNDLARAIEAANELECNVLRLTHMRHFGVVRLLKRRHEHEPRVLLYPSLHVGDLWPESSYRARNFEITVRLFRQVTRRSFRFNRKKIGRSNRIQIWAYRCDR